MIRTQPPAWLPIRQKAFLINVSTKESIQEAPGFPGNTIAAEAIAITGEGMAANIAERIATSMPNSIPTGIPNSIVSSIAKN
ncbi:hypothetical protein D3C81_1912150 [compost metagenome]